MAASPRAISLRGMATSPDQAAVPPSEAPAAPPPAHHRPWGWIVACVLLLLVAVGLAIWALSLNSDLDTQRAQTAKAQQQAEQAGKDVEALSAEVDQISQSVSDAGDQLSQAGADAQQNAQQTLDGVGTKVESLKGQVQKAANDAGASKETSAP
jgi:peptidoglycan hydrolase CwlO-like protein